MLCVQGRRWNNYFYPRPPRGGRRVSDPRSLLYYAISIHALREEGDRKMQSQESYVQISIHALREEGDPDSALSAVL